MKKGFTLMELIIVVVIVGVLAVLATTQYGSYRENAFDKEAKANLRLIQAAERIYHMENGFYYPSNATNTTPATADINSYLRLLLPSGTSPVWNYTITDHNGTSRARRTVGGRNWTLNITAEEPTSP